MNLTGDKISLLRSKLKLTQAAFAKSVNYSRSYVNDIESGRVKPSRDFLEALKEKYGISIDDLLSNDSIHEFDQIPIVSSRLEIEKHEDSRIFTICIHIVMEYQDGLKEKMSNEKYGKLLFTLWKILSCQSSDEQTEDKAKEILKAIIKLVDDFETFRNIRTDNDCKKLLMSFVINPDK